MKATNNIEKKLKEYLKKNLLPNNFNQLKIKEEIKEETSYCSPKLIERKCNINNFLVKELDKNSFQTKLFNLIDESGKKDSDIYNCARIDRRLFSKIRNDSNYHPSKITVIALGLALKLDIKKFEELLTSASYSLPKNNYFDLIIRFCIQEKIYNITDVNTYLYQYNCNTIN